MSFIYYKIIQKNKMMLINSKVSSNSSSLFIRLIQLVDVYSEFQQVYFQFVKMDP
jgi:hypothetical protein